MRWRRLFKEIHPTGVSAYLCEFWISIDFPQIIAVPRELDGALPALVAVPYRLCRVMWEINKDPLRVRICRLKHLSDDGFGAGRFAGRRGRCTFAEISHRGCGLCAMKRSRGMEDGGGQKVYGAGSCWNNPWQPEDVGL